ncbi:MAG: Hsp20 family protein [Bacilli bacterium]|nr:Hsp20 family protein [Bacilli bacterium]
MLLPDRIFDDMFDLGEVRGPKERMDCDIYEKDGKYFVEASIAGFNKDEIKVEAEDGSIIISAEKNEDSKEENKDKKYLRRERHFHSKVQRAFYLGDIDEDSIKASFDNGVLTVEVPKKKIESNKKLIDIE